MNVEFNEWQSSKEPLEESTKLKQKCRTVEEEDYCSDEVACDDVSGATLEPKEVRGARSEEIKYVRDMGLYEKVPIEQCYNKTGKAAISTRWIDINKGDQTHPSYWSRLVARETNTHRRDDLFVAAPSLEALKAILSMTAISSRGEVVMINDISRASCHVRAKREVFVQLPQEDINKGEEDMCGKLKYSVYGTRDAAQNWYQEYSGQLVKNGFEQGKASPCIFYHWERSIGIYVHGDDYLSIGKPEHLEWMRVQFEAKYIIKTQISGPGEIHTKQVKISNRIVTWDNTKGILYEADPRHIEIILKQLLLNEPKPVSSPGTREEGRTSEDCETLLSDKDATNYRAIVARCNYLSPDRPDIAFAVKELARAMSKPTKGDMQRLKRLARYIKGKPRLVMQYSWQPKQSTFIIYSDADWAGCRVTRKSTTRGCMKLGSHCFKGWSKTQSLVALSSGESELYASLKASAETLGLLSMLRDLGWRWHREVWGDANVALEITLL